VGGVVLGLFCNGVVRGLESSKWGVKGGGGGGHKHMINAGEGAING